MKTRLRPKYILPALGVLLAASCFLKENFNSMCLILLVSAVLVSTLRERDFQAWKSALRSGWPLILYFVLALLGYFLNRESNFPYLVRLLPFLIAPALIVYCSLKNAQKALIYGFVAGNCLLLAYLDLLAIRDMVAAQSLFVNEGGAENYRFLYTRFTGDLFNHIYLSTYSLMSAALVLQFVTFRRRALKFLLVAYLVAHIVLLGSRAVVIGMLGAAFLSLVLLSILNRRYLKYLLLMLGGLLLMTATVYSFKDTLLMNRYAQVFKWYENWDLLLERDYSINNRAKIYIVGFSMFSDRERYGINGTGLASAAIQAKYESHFRDNFELNTTTYNPHNQYVNNFIDWGILGLALLCFLVIKPVTISFRSGVYWVGFFWLAFLIILAMESELIRHRGIVFFVLFYSVFLNLTPALKNE